MKVVSNSMETLKKAVISGELEEAVSAMEQVLGEDIQPLAIANFLQDCLRYVGILFEEKEYFLPEMLASAKTVQECCHRLRPRLLEKGAKDNKGIMVLGTVRNDVHDVGKNIVKMVLEAHGFEIYDLGVNVPSEKFVEVARQVNARIIGISALLTVTMPGMQKTVEAVRSSDLRDALVVVGGAPITQKFADQIGADGYAEDAIKAVTVIENILKVRTVRT
jgi:5-methyltetrahydrofolate--homocysteine methyltransferase